MKERMAPGHVYDEQLGTGMHWAADTVTLYEAGTPTGTARHTTASAREFWMGLHFREAFPDVTHWWFRSIWTGRVKVSYPDPRYSADGDIRGWMTFDTLDQPKLLYTISDDDPVAILTPFPPHEAQRANLPLRLVLARIVAGIVTEETEIDQWYAVTSLAESAELHRYLPATIEEADAIFGGWRLMMSSEPLREPIREEWATALGL